MMSKRNAGSPPFFFLRNFFLRLPGLHQSRYTASNDWE